MKKIDKNFKFNGKMSEDVLRNYLSRAVSFQGLCAENTSRDMCFEDDLRMIKNIGAKFIGRTAFYSWGGNMSTKQIEEHFKIVEECAKKAHEVDDELILQAGVFEIIFEGTVNSTPIPDWIFEEFDLAPERRNFSFEALLPPAPSKFGRGFWGGKQDTAIPYIGSIETQMYFYYLITRYIDLGYEAIHLGQVELIMNKEEKCLADWDRVLTKARNYAKQHARRGVVLFDGHRELHSNGFKYGDRLLADFYSCGAIAHETEIKDGAEMARLHHYMDEAESELSWIGRAAGGKHPLGFDTDEQISICELDNFGGTAGDGIPHQINSNRALCWGYDPITWYAIQPEWYRNQYLIECDDFLGRRLLDKSGRQNCFMQFACRRVICPEDDDRPVFHIDSSEAESFKNFDLFLRNEAIVCLTDKTTNNLLLTQKKQSFYRANRKSVNCPTGSGQEDTIKEIFSREDR